MTCLACGRPADIREQYNGIDIQVCEDGHRTGVIDAECPLNALGLDSSHVNAN